MSWRQELWKAIDAMCAFQQPKRKRLRSHEVAIEAAVDAAFKALAAPPDHPGGISAEDRNRLTLAAFVLAQDGNLDAWDKVLDEVLHRPQGDA